ncbi:MAG: hypothetical protein AAF696_04810 [Bacteroidota bacterium]
MKPLVHTYLLALIFCLGLFPQLSFAQDKLSNWYIQEVFLLADLNQDKYLSETEIIQLQENFAYYQNPENFEHTDKNNDGYLDYPEFRYRFGQALVHRQEIDEQELMSLSEEYPYFEDAAYKYLKRHPELTAHLTNNLVWTRANPDLMKQLIADKGWLSKEKQVLEALSSNLIWLSENPHLARKFYGIKKQKSISNIWKSWSISHQVFLANNDIEEGIQIDFPYWPSEKLESSSKEMIAAAPSPGEQQQWVDSLLMANQSLQSAYQKSDTELKRRDSVAESIFIEEIDGNTTEDFEALRAENEDLRTRVRQMMIEQKLARIEEDQLLETTIRQRQQIATMKKEQELSEEEGEGALVLNPESPLADELEKLKEENNSKAQRIKDLNQSIASINEANLGLQKENQELSRLSKSLTQDKLEEQDAKEKLLQELKERETQMALSGENREKDLLHQIDVLRLENQALLTAQEEHLQENEELEENLIKVIESKKDDNKDLLAIEEQYQQQILALEIELEKSHAQLIDNKSTKESEVEGLAASLKTSKEEIAALEQNIVELQNSKKSLKQSLSSQASLSVEVESLRKENKEMATELAMKNQQMVAMMAEQESIKQANEQEETQSIEEFANAIHLQRERDSLAGALETVVYERNALELQLSTQKDQINQQEKALEEQEAALAVQNASPNEGDDALYLRVNELEYHNSRLKDELEATLSLANEREAILEKRLKSSLKESKRMAAKMNRFKRRKRFFETSEGEKLDELTLELDAQRNRLAEMDEVNKALLAQLQANNNYLGQNISQRAQYQQEMSRLKSGISKLESENDSLQFLIDKGMAFQGPQQDSLLAYQERIYKLEQKIFQNQSNSKLQISRLNLEIDSLKTEVDQLEEDKISIARVHKAEASRSQRSDNRERRLLDLQMQLKEKELTLIQKEKVIHDKMQEITLKERKYQDMRRWEEELHLLERKLKNTQGYKEATRKD